MKKLNRKEFIKFTGIAALFGMAGKGAVNIVTELEATPKKPFKAKPGQKRYGMVIDTRKCKEGCNVCMDKCHEEYNVPRSKVKGYDKNELKWLWKEEAHYLFPDESRYQTYVNPKKKVLTVCMHCDNPPCVRVCPTQATFKRESDGIVMMDFHRCIGCRFCMAGCPYGARSFNYFDPRKSLDKINPDFPTRTMGVVEKCSFCAERVVENKQPHCVKVCPEKALTFGDLNDPKSEINRVLKENRTMRRKPELGAEPCVFYIV